MIKVLKPDFSFVDERGSLTQLVHEGYKQVNVIESKKDAFRGKHYHKVNEEAFYIISGSFKLEASKLGSDIIETYDFKTGDMFLVESYVVHSFYFLEDTTLVTMYSLGVELPDGNKDIYES